MRPSILVRLSTVIGLCMNCRFDFGALAREGWIKVICRHPTKPTFSTCRLTGPPSTGLAPCWTTQPPSLVLWVGIAQYEGASPLECCLADLNAYRRPESFLMSDPRFQAGSCASLASTPVRCMDHSVLRQIQIANPGKLVKISHMPVVSSRKTR